MAVSMRLAIVDLFGSLKTWRLWSLMGWLDIRQRYARSAIGPFWITLSMGVMVGAIGMVYGTLLGQNTQSYLPLEGMGFVIWGLISGVLNDSCGAYVNNATYILQSETSLWIYVWQVVWRQLIIFAHNFLIVLILLAVYGVHNWTSLPLFLPGLALLVINLSWLARVLATASARYRDIPQFVASLVQILFYITPLMWRPSMLTKHHWLININPFTSLVDIVRGPLLGQVPATSSWAIAGVMAIVGWVIALWSAAKFSNDVAYWM